MSICSACVAGVLAVTQADNILEFFGDWGHAEGREQAIQRDVHSNTAPQSKNLHVQPNEQQLKGMKDNQIKKRKTENEIKEQNNLFGVFDSIFIPINRYLAGVSRRGIVRYTAILMIVIGLLTFWGGLLLMDSVSLDGHITAIGLMSLVSGLLLSAAAIGLFQRKEWGRNLAVIAFLFEVISSILGLLIGGGILNILWIGIDFYLAYFFSQDEELKAQFS